MRDSWQLIPLEAMASFSRGVSWRKEEESKNGEGVAVLSIPNIGRGRLDFNAKHRLKKPPHPSKLLAVGDVLFVGSSGSIDNIARNARVTKLPAEPVAFASFTFKATPRQDICAPTFFYFLMNSALPAFTNFARRAADGKFNFQLTSFVERSAFRIPPLDEQQQIAAMLSAVQRAIERQERLIALTAELKKALMHKLFTEGTRGEPLKQSEIGQLPQSWNPTPLGTCCDVVSSSMSYADFVNAAGSTDDDAVSCMAVKVSDMNLPGNEATFVTANAVKHLPAATATRKLVPPNAVVFPKRGAAIATNKKRLTTTWTALDPNLIALYAKEDVDPQFLFYWSQIFDLRTITDPGPTPQLNKKDLTPVKLPLPPTLEEQRLVTDGLDVVNAKWLLQRRELACLNELFRTLLHQLITAQIRIHDLDLSALEETVREPVGAA
jgi:type I restriction enzyme S subunit